MTTDDEPLAQSRMKWGDEIRKIREGQGLSQRRVARLADADRASLFCVEKVRQQPGKPSSRHQR